MHLRIYSLLAFTIFITSGCNGATEKDRQSSKDRSTAAAASYNAYTDDDIYISDQEDLEGSGRGGDEVREDLEASGSGFGPDDEDGDDDADFDIHSRIEPNLSKPVEPKTSFVEPIVTRTKQTNVGTINRPDSGIDLNEPIPEDEQEEDSDDIREVHMNPKNEEHASSFFAQPGVLAAVIGGAVVGLLCAILVVMFIVYRMRKKDEGSYALDEPRRSPAAQAYPKPGAPHHNREFYA